MKELTAAVLVLTVVCAGVMQANASVIVPATSSSMSLSDDDFSHFPAGSPGKSAPSLHDPDCPDSFSGIPLGTSASPASGPVGHHMSEAVVMPPTPSGQLCDGFAIFIPMPPQQDLLRPPQPF